MGVGLSIEPGKVVAAVPGRVAPPADEAGGGIRASVRAALSSMVVPGLAFAVALVLFGIFIALTGHSPLSVYYQMYRGSFGTAFSFQNTLVRAAPLMLTALATALPLRLGLVGLGGEGAMVLGGLGAAAMAVAMGGHSPMAIKTTMMMRPIMAKGLRAKATQPR